MPSATGTATDHADLFAKLRTFLKAAGPTGPAWTEQSYDGTNLRMLFTAPGLAGTEAIGVGFSLHSDVGADVYALGGLLFKSYSSLFDYSHQPGSCTESYHLLWNQPMKYWFVANGQRVIIATKVSTVYTASYLGKILPRSLPGDYPQPYYQGMQAISPFNSTRWSTVSEDNRNFFDPGVGSQLLTPSGEWWSVQNFFESSGESPVSAAIYTWPYSGCSSGSPTSRYREQRENLDGSYSLDPIELIGNTPSLEMYGELDGAYAVTGFNQASEDTMTIGGTTYLVVQNVFRTARYQYAAIKLS